MEVPNLIKEDLICLLDSSDAAIHEAIDKVRPNLKQNLNDKELLLLRSSMVSLRGRFRSRYAAAARKKPRFMDKHSGWLKTSFRLPICLLQDWVNDSGGSGSGPEAVKELRKCANCQNEVNEDAKGDETEKSLEKTLQAFQVIFEGLLKQNNVKLSEKLPELCSNCESLLLSLHTLYVDFMNLTEMQSPVHILLGRSILWKDRAKSESVINSRHSNEPRVKRQSLKAIEASQAKILKQTQNQPEPDCSDGETLFSELHHEDSNFVELEDHLEEPEEPETEDPYPLPVVVTQSQPQQPRLPSLCVKQALGFECVQCSTTFIGQNGYLKHRGSNHLIFPEPHYKSTLNDNRLIQVIRKSGSTLVKHNVDEDCVLIKTSCTVANIHGGQESLEKMGSEQVMKEITDTSIQIRKTRAPRDRTNPKRKYTKKPIKIYSTPSIQKKPPKQPKPSRTLVAVVHKYKTRQSEKIAKSHICPYCDEIFERQKTFNTHIVSHAQIPQPHLNFPLTNHESDSGVPVPVSCLKTSEEENTSCQECSKTYLNRTSYRRHLRWHRKQLDPNFPCPHCGDLVKGIKLLLHHIRFYHTGTRGTMSKERPFVCPYKPCLFAYRATTKANLMGHIYKFHAEQRDKDKSRPFQCDACPSAYREQEALDRHNTIMHSHHPCHLCDKVFSPRAYLISHLQRVHIPLDESETIQCEICDVKCRNKAKLKIHLLKHQSKRTKSNLCDLCGKRYTNAHELKLHIRIFHEGIKKHVCPHCGIAFGKLSVMKNHVRAKHEPSTGPGFPCTICGKVFKLKTYLYQHSISKVHGGPGLSRSKRRENAKREETEEAPPLEQADIQQGRELLDSETVQTFKVMDWNSIFNE